MYSNKIDNEKNFQIINYRNYVQDENKIKNNFIKKYNDDNGNHNNQFIDSNNKYLEFKQFLYEKLSKKQYKFVLYQIELNIFSYLELDQKYELKFLKIEALLKILNNKIKKYHKSKLLNDYQSKQKNNFIKRVNSLNLKHYKLIFKKATTNFTISTKSTKSFISIENYFYKIDNLLEGSIEDIEKISENNKIYFIEKIIQLYLKLLITREYYNKIENKIPNNFCYLSFCEQIINNFYPYMRNSFSLTTSSIIFLIIAKSLISNNDFQNAESYCVRTVNLCIKECFLLTKIDNDDLKKISFKTKEKVILNLSISLFYIGICKENQGNIKMALKYYSLSEMIIKNLLLNDDEVEENEEKIKNYNLYHKFILSVKQRCQDYFNIILNLLKQNSIVVIEKIRRKKKLEEIQKINDKKNEKDINFISLNKRMKKIEEKINKIEIPKEININRQSKLTPLKQSLNVSSSEKIFSYKSYILSDLRLLDDFSCNSFKKTLNSMEKIKLIDLDISIKEKLEKIFERKNYKKQLFYNNKNYFQSFRKTSIQLRKHSPNIFQQYKNDSLNERNYLNKSINNNNTFIINNYQLKKNNSPSKVINIKNTKNDKYDIISLSHNKFKRNKTRIERLKINNNFERSNSFKQKKIYVNGLRDRETAFLKKLLKIKSEEKLFENNNFNLMNVKREAEKKFEIIKECNTNDEGNLKDKIQQLLFLKKKENNEKKKQTKIIQNLSENNLLTKYDKKKKLFFFNNKELTNNHNKNIIENINFDIEDLSKERRGLEEEIREMKLGKIN